MKRLIIPFVAAFGLSLGIATGVVVMRAPKAAPIPATVAQVKAVPKTDTVSVPRDSAPPAVVDSAATAANSPPSGKPNAAATQATVASGPSAKPGGEAAAIGRSAPQPPPATLAKSPAPTRALLSAVPKAPAPKPVSDSLISRRLAQVFGAMQSKDAARVLEQMDDSDVRTILGSLSSKQQAAILGSFPTQRAAVILQATLRPGSSTGTK